MTGSGHDALYRWMWPAWWIGRIRPGLRSATAADAARLRELPGLVGQIVLPGLAILLPILLSIGNATTHKGFWQPDMTTPSALVIYDVFTESIPFTIAAGIIGLCSPAAGAVLTLVYAVGNLAATAWTEELYPLVGVTFGRLVSCLVLWLLVVEIPLMGRGVFEWWSSRDASPRGQRTVAVVAAALSVTALTWIWVQAAPLLIVVQFFRTFWAQPPYPPFGIIVENGWMVVAAMGLGTLLVFALRYLGASAHVARGDQEPGAMTGGARRWAYAGTMLLALLTLASVIHQPVDALILLAGLLAARPVARAVLRRGRLAPILAAIAPPIRLIAGFGVTLAFAWVFVAVVGPSERTPFFHTVIAIAVGFIILEVFLAADEVAAETQAAAAPPPAAGESPIARAVALGALLYLLTPTVARADNFADENDVKGMAAAAAASAAGAKAWDTAMKKKFPPKTDGGTPAGGSSPGGASGGGPSAGGGSPDGGTSDSPFWQRFMPDGFNDFMGKN
jgi:uncharacterized membrane protein YgcG